MTRIATPDGAPAGNRFDAIEALLSRYPDISESELGDLRHWFRTEASAFEVASLASKDAIRAPYEDFRSQNIDRLTTRDFAMIGAAVIGLGGLLAAGLWLA